MLLVVPREKALTEGAAILDAAKPIREVRPVLQGAEVETSPPPAEPPSSGHRDPGRVLADAHEITRCLDAALIQNKLHKKVASQVPKVKQVVNELQVKNQKVTSSKGQ